MSLVWKIEKVGRDGYRVLRDGIDMLPIKVDIDFARNFVRKARNPDDRVCISDTSGTKFITKEFSRGKKG